MYYESYLQIDAGGDPARPRPARQLLRNPYLLHQRIAAAFGRDPRRQPDAKERVARSEHHNWVLFRLIAPARVVQVRSGRRPDWDEGFRKHSSRERCLHLLACPRVEEVDPVFSAGDRLRFSLRANPTVKKKDSPDNTDHKKHKHGYRVSLCYPGRAFDYLKRKGVPVDADAERRARKSSGDAVEEGDREARDAVVTMACEQWLKLKGEQGGFELESCLPIREGFRLFKKPDGRKSADRKRDLFFGSVLFEGTLQITDPEAFKRTLCAGIGPGKAFGFGLLSVAPCA